MSHTVVPQYPREMVSGRSTSSAAWPGQSVMTSTSTSTASGSSGAPIAAHDANVIRLSFFASVTASTSRPTGLTDSHRMTARR